LGYIRNLALERRDWRRLTGVQEWEMELPLMLVLMTVAGSQRKKQLEDGGRGGGSLVGPFTPVSRVVGQLCWVGLGLSPMGMGSVPMD
jgi:hypothetical protein